MLLKLTLLPTAKDKQSFLWLNPDFIVYLRRARNAFSVGEAAPSITESSMRDITAIKLAHCDDERKVLETPEEIIALINLPDVEVTK